MCIFFRYRKVKHYLECSCELCGSNFECTEDMERHMNRHRVSDASHLLKSGYGIVRCNQCWTAFVSMESLACHSCVDCAPLTLNKIIISD